MGENEFIGNCSVPYEKEQIGNAIKQFIESYCKFYGIRNRKTNKFIYIGTLDDRILWCDSEKTEYATLMQNEENIKSVYNIMVKNYKDFNKNYFVDKVKDEDYNHELIEPIWNKFA